MIVRPAALSSSLLSSSLCAALTLQFSGTVAAVAAPKTPNYAASALTFNVTARVAANGQFSGQQQTIQARVLLSGKAARIETSNSGAAKVVLFTPPYVYRLLPASKAGVRWKIPRTQASGMAGFDPQTFLRDPAKLKTELVHGGAKKIGTGTIGKSPVDIYQAKNFNGTKQQVKLWLRKSDSLPLRLETAGGDFKIIASWQNYARPKNLPHSLFEVPLGFVIRDTMGEPPFASL